MKKIKRLFSRRLTADGIVADITKKVALLKKVSAERQEDAAEQDKKIAKAAAAKAKHLDEAAKAVKFAGKLENLVS